MRLASPAPVPWRSRRRPRRMRPRPRSRAPGRFRSRAAIVRARRHRQIPAARPPLPLVVRSGPLPEPRQAATIPPIQFRLSARRRAPLRGATTPPTRSTPSVRFPGRFQAEGNQGRRFRLAPTLRRDSARDAACPATRSRRPSPRDSATPRARTILVRRCAPPSRRDSARRPDRTRRGGRSVRRNRRDSAAEPRLADPGRTPTKKDNAPRKRGVGRRPRWDLNPRGNAASIPPGRPRTDIREKGQRPAQAGRWAKAAVGFEPTNHGFAIRSLRPLGYAADGRDYRTNPSARQREA